MHAKGSLGSPFLLPSAGERNAMGGKCGEKAATIRIPSTALAQNVEAPQSQLLSESLLRFSVCDVE
jgi:hypothetical protein